MNSTTSLNVGTRFALIAGLALTSIFAVAMPTFSHAASYAFVNQSGNVSMVVADSAMLALSTAVGISTHSGVMLLNSQADTELVGDKVSGI